MAVTNANSMMFREAPVCVERDGVCRRNLLPLHRACACGLFLEVKGPMSREGHLRAEPGPYSTKWYQKNPLPLDCTLTGYRQNPHVQGVPRFCTPPRTAGCRTLRPEDDDLIVSLPRSSVALGVVQAVVPAGWALVKQSSLLFRRGTGGVRNRGTGR